jgi:hypothetical protein
LTNEELEIYMADFILKEAPEDVTDFIDAIQQSGVTQEEVDEVRQITLETLKDPSNYPRFAQYLISTELLEKKVVPPSFDAGFVLSILGLIGVVQRIVTPS